MLGFQVAAGGPAGGRAQSQGVKEAAEAASSAPAGGMVSNTKQVMRQRGERGREQDAGKREGVLLAGMVGQIPTSNPTSAQLH